MYSILVIGVLVVVYCGIGWTIVSRLDSMNKLSDGERLTLSFFVGGFAVYFGVFLVAPMRLDVTTMSGLAFVCALLALPGLKKIPWREIYLSNIRILKLDWFSKLLWITLFIVAVTTLIQGLAPPNDYDSLMYHLANPLYGVELGRFEIPDDRRGVQALFPAMMSNLTRFLLVFADGETVQMAHGLYGLAAAVGAGFLMRRFGYSVHTALAAVLFFLVIRAVIWQMASAETDVPLAGFLIGSFIVYLTLRKTPTSGLGILFGLMIGGMILTKYIGFALALLFGVLIIYDVLKTGKIWVLGLIGPAVSLLIILPHITRNIILTGNPIFPLFNSFFNLGKIDPYGSTAGSLGTGRSLLDLVTAPWNMFVTPMQYFDGMVMGAPYLLAFSPLVFLDRDNLKKWFLTLPIILGFFLIWFYLLSQQVRFLLPLMPIIAAMAAAGMVFMWENMRSSLSLKFGFFTIVAVLGLNQIMFVGVYAAVRLPVAIGLISASDYHKNTPTMNGAFYKTCTFIRNNLKTEETYYSNLRFPSYYCPQAAMVYKRLPEEEKFIFGSGKTAEYSPGGFLSVIEKSNFRYFILMTGYETRRGASDGYKSRENTAAKSISISMENIDYRFKRHLSPILKNLKPLSQGRFSAVYDGREVLVRLKELQSGKKP